MGEIIMPKFSMASKKRLDTCDTRLQEICNEAIKEYDFIVLCGYRNKEDQEVAYLSGASKLRWPNSKHNKQPSMAVDLAPYPIDWKNIQRFKDLAAVIHKIASAKNIPIVWGGEWDSFKDYPHYQLTTTSTTTTKKEEIMATTITLPTLNFAGKRTYIMGIFGIAAVWMDVFYGTGLAPMVTGDPTATNLTPTLAAGITFMLLQGMFLRAGSKADANKVINEVNK